jgi:2'-5' RNA ligase
MRLFVALTLPADEQERIYRAAAPLREAALPVRWSRPESLHLTLKFLGEVLPEAVPEIEGAIATAATRTTPFTLPLGGVGAFPTLRRPRVIWMGAEATPQLRCLKQELEWEISPLGFPSETQHFRPHLTLGRARADARAGDFRRLEALAAAVPFEARLEVATVELIQSHLTPGGSRYERIAVIPLG